MPSGPLVPSGSDVPSAPGLLGPLAFVDDDANEVLLEPDDAKTFSALTGDLDSATVSACPGCAARVLACVAVVDLLDDAPPHPRARDVLELADDAPTLHLYVVDLLSTCRHDAWRDPGYAEWREAIGDVVDDAHGPR